MCMDGVPSSLGEDSRGGKTLELVKFVCFKWISVMRYLRGRRRSKIHCLIYLFQFLQAETVKRLNKGTCEERQKMLKTKESLNELDERREGGRDVLFVDLNSRNKFDFIIAASRDEKAEIKSRQIVKPIRSLPKSHAFIIRFTSFNQNDTHGINGNFYA